MRAVVSLLLLILLALPACSTSRAPADDGDVAEPVAEVDWSAVETFDPAPYQEEAPRPDAVEHDVPARLMEARAASGGTRAARGFRIQVLSTLDKDEAVEREQALKAWWAGRAPEARPAGLGGEQLSVYVHYRQPYYRVRVGNFASRDAAEGALRVLGANYPEAFIVPDDVTLPR